MPSMLSHFLFALDRLAECSGDGASDPFSAALRSHRDLVLAGTQGPDPFFFYAKVPLRSRSAGEGVHDFGTHLHVVDPARVFPLLAEAACRERGGRRDIAYAYLYGLLLHYVLDRSVHPYVFSHTGFDADGFLKGRFFADHVRFETLLGVSSLDRRVRGTGSAFPRFRDTRPGRSMRVDEDGLGVAGDLWAAAFPDQLRPRTLPDSWSDMRAVLSLLWDPTGVKRVLFRVLGASSSTPRALIPPRRPRRSDPIDYLNDGAGPWPDPVTGVESTATVESLVSDATALAGKARTILSRAYAGEEVRNLWGPFLGGVNHEGCLEGQRMRHFRSVYDVAP